MDHHKYNIIITLLVKLMIMLWLAAGQTIVYIRVQKHGAPRSTLIQKWHSQNDHLSD